MDSISWHDPESYDDYIDRDVEIIVDLGEQYRISRVQTHWHWERTANIRFPEPLEISVSVDGTTWSTPVLVQVANDDNRPGWLDADIGLSGRYVKLSWVARDHWYHISEVQIFEARDE